MSELANSGYIRGVKEELRRCSLCESLGYCIRIGAISRSSELFRCAFLSIQQVPQFSVT
jgi:hypothetical protein